VVDGVNNRPATAPVTAPGTPADKAPDKLRQATQEFEAVFVQMILSQMRSANREMGGDETNFSRDIYEGWQDEQTARSISQSGGIGLGEALYRQLQQQQLAGATAPVAATPVTPAVAAEPEKRKE
jgi:flagellar protein FlgJ